MQYKITICSILIGMLLGSIQALACWIAIEPEIYASECPIIISGTIAKTDGLISDKYFDGYDIAYIKIRKVFKNVLKGVDLNKGQNFSVQMSPIRKNIGVSTDIRYQVGKKGIWLVYLDSKGNFHIDFHPVQFQPLKKEKELRKKGTFITETELTEDGKKITKLYTIDEWIAHVKVERESRKTKN